MVDAAVRKKRPCSECRRWFLPDPRVGGRQKTCGAAACQRARHERACRDWRTKNRDYDRDRRWREVVEAARMEPRSVPPTSRARPPVAGVPWDVVQDEMRVEGRVILAGVVRVIGDFVQDEMRRQAADYARKFGGHMPDPPQAEMEAAG